MPPAEPTPDPTPDPLPADAGPDDITTLVFHLTAGQRRRYRVGLAGVAAIVWFLGLVRLVVVRPGDGLVGLVRAGGAGRWPWGPRRWPWAGCCRWWCSTPAVSGPAGASGGPR